MSVLASEWVKIRSIRSGYVSIGAGLAALAVGALIAWSAIAMYDTATPSMRRSASIAEVEEVVVMLPQLSMGILGVLTWVSDRVLRTSLTLVPRRLPVLTAKAVVVAALGLAVGVVTVFGTFFLVHLMLDGRYPVATFAERWPTLAVTGLSVMVYALLGLGLGAVLRRTGAAVAVLAGLVYVLPMLFNQLPAPWNERVNSVMIAALPRQISGASLENSVFGDILPPVVAALVLAAYAVVPLLAGAWLLRRRDA
ncbi:ABC transporter permease subunit [Nonomuraea longicatena]|uniref:ABC transporter permease subunit n=1 Tax=Nonomuraea longicatena TaxID=83682 RepID=A0ABN1PHY8_9ACTN